MASVEFLPNPNTVSEGSAYLVGTQAPYHLYVLIMQPERSWFDTGSFNNMAIIDLSGVSGTLSSTDYQTLLSSQGVMIKLDNEDIFRLNNETSSALVYNTVDRFNVTKPTEKYIVVNKSTRGWQLYSEALLIASDLDDYATLSALNTGLAAKQNTLVSSQNIKTINNESLLGAGNISLVTDLSDYSTTAQMNAAIEAYHDDTKQDVIDASHKLSAANVSGLAAVATSGSYLDLGNRPSLASVATSGNYNDLLSKPTIPTVPTDISAFNNDVGYITSAALSGYATESYVGSQGYITSSALSGYATESYVGSQGFITSAALSGYATEVYVGNQLSNYATTSAMNSALSIYAQTSSLASVATSGLYADLINKPNIPTKVSDLTNDTGFITSSALSGYATESYVNSAIQGLGTVFNIKGSVATVADLPASGNTVGDVYYVEATQSGYIWIEVNNTEQWEELGAPIDLSGYATESYVSSYITSALTPYATQSYVSNALQPYATTVAMNNALSDYTPTSGLSIYALASSIPTNNNQLTNGAGYITSSALSGYATESYVASALTPYTTTTAMNSALSGYLPLSGGTINGNLSLSIGSSTGTLDAYKIYAAELGRKIDNEPFTYLSFGSIGGTLSYGYVDVYAQVLKPNINNAGNLGRANYKWNTLYATNYYDGSTTQPFSGIATQAYVQSALSSISGGGGTVPSGVYAFGTNVFYGNDEPQSAPNYAIWFKPYDDPNAESGESEEEPSEEE